MWFRGHVTTRFVEHVAPLSGQKQQKQRVCIETRDGTLMQASSLFKVKAQTPKISTLSPKM